MYSWGDDTSIWKNPGKYNYDAAKKPYLEKLAKEADSERTYTKKKEPNLTLVDPKGKTISSQSENPIIVCVDGTRSMQKWPAEIFDRLPLLYQTLSQYRDDIEISFAVIGDALTDSWPLQIGNFGKGPSLDTILKGLKPEGGGGPGIRENYELFAYYIHEHAETPKAKKPFLFIMGDEMFYDDIDPEKTKKYLGDTLQSPLKSVSIWRDLTERYEMYLLRKALPGYDEKIEQQWTEALGEQQRIIPIEDPMRVVDTAMGIVAKSWGHFSNFEKNLSARQDSDNIGKVMKSLRAADIKPSSKKGGT